MDNLSLNHPILLFGYRQAPLQNNHKFNWFLDFLILAGFLLSFNMELTGVEIHQWLGISLLLLVIIHLCNHWEWIKTFIKRNSRRVTVRNRIFGLIDLLLLAGMLMIIGTGLVISTWFTFDLDNYSVWLNLHIYFSIGTLVLTVVKIGLHWRWIVNITRQIFHPSVHSPFPVENNLSMSRRQFLALMGLISLGSALAVANVLPKVRSSSTSTQTENVEITEIQTETEPVAEPQPSATQPQLQTSQPEEMATAISQPTAQPIAACTYTCRRGNHCAFPGQCHDYRDTNNNGLCDKGECS